MKEKKNLGSIMGSIFGVVITGCFMAIAIAMTYKIIMWIL